MKIGNMSESKEKETIPSDGDKGRNTTYPWREHHGRWETVCEKKACDG